MTYQLTEEDLRLAIADAVTERSELTLDDLLEELLPGETSNVSSVLADFIAQEFFTQSKKQCRFLAKNYIVTKFKNGSSEFISQFIAAQTEDELIEVFSLDLSIRLKTLKSNDVLGSLLVECTRVFNRLREKFSPAQSEDQLRMHLVEWFQSGLMQFTIWKVFKEWKLKNPTLAHLRNLNEPRDALKDAKWREFKRLLSKIKTDNFVELNKMKNILDILFSPAQLSVKNGTVKLIGRIVYLSEWLSRIQDSIESANATEVSMYAEDYLAIDCDLTDKVWRGKNLVIVSRTVNICKERAVICLSGESFPPGNRKKASSGANGRHGRAGESSGNLAILATKMFNSMRLTVELNGGRGEDGEDGGDGCDGKDGVGVEKQDLDKLVVKYQSIYRDSWTQFYDYSPPSNWIKQSGSSSSGDYIYRTYKDENGREMTYSFASDKGWVYTTYELFFLIRGSNGTMGSSGGSNGVGGQGGYNGTCLVRNPETNEEFQISLIKEGKSNGYNGENGKVGKSGKHGLNGNDMVLIDRSAKEASKHYIGILDRKLSWNYNYKSEDKNRLDGYKRYSEKENACFRKFQYGETIDRSEERASRAQAQTVRKTLSEAVAKQSIVLSKVLAETESLFEKQNAFLADACEASSKASLANDADEEEQEETNENVTEEVVILRQKEDTKSLLLKYTSQSNQKVS